MRDSDGFRKVIVKARPIDPKSNLGPTISTTAALIRETINEVGDFDGVQTTTDLLATEASFESEKLSSNRRGPIPLLENATLEYDSG